MQSLILKIVARSDKATNRPFSSWKDEFIPPNSTMSNYITITSLLLICSAFSLSKIFFFYKRIAQASTKHCYRLRWSGAGLHSCSSAYSRGHRIQLHTGIGPVQQCIRTVCTQSKALLVLVLRSLFAVLCVLCWPCFRFALFTGSYGEPVSQAVTVTGYADQFES